MGLFRPVTGQLFNVCFEVLKSNSERRKQRSRHFVLHSSPCRIKQCCLDPCMRVLFYELKKYRKFKDQVLLSSNKATEIREPINK